MADLEGTERLQVVPDSLPRGVFWLSAALVAVGALALVGSGFTAAFLGLEHLFKPLMVGLAGLVTAGFGAAGLSWSQSVVAARIRRAERQARGEHNPLSMLDADETSKASWDVAVVKLESYLDRNLAQVDAIFRLATSVMVAGFLLISGGVFMAFLDAGGVATLSAQAAAIGGQGAAPSAPFVSPTDPSVTAGGSLSIAMISAAAGVLVEFIGATLMVIYRSTMSQAERYMRVLERINAVGMSVMIIGSIKDDKALYNQGLVKVAEQMLAMYSDSERPSSSPGAASGPPATAPDVSVG